VFPDYIPDNEIHTSCKDIIVSHPIHPVRTIIHRVPIYPIHPKFNSALQLMPPIPKNAAHPASLGTPPLFAPQSARGCQSLVLRRSWGPCWHKAVAHPLSAASFPCLSLSPPSAYPVTSATSVTSVTSVTFLFSHNIRPPPRITKFFTTTQKCKNITFYMKLPCPCSSAISSLEASRTCPILLFNN
jgi:hypothetical protein